MTYSESSLLLTSEAIQLWLEQEAANSTFDRNSYLDNLEDGRRTLVERNDPKIGNHATRMSLWLDAYDYDSLSAEDSVQRSRNVAFGARMFLSGDYRKQRYLQAVDQEDYLDRKLNWHHPNGVQVVPFIKRCLALDKLTRVTNQAVKISGLAALKTAEDSIQTIYERTPLDFGKGSSESVKGIRQEQANWLKFLIKVLIHASFGLNLALEDIPIFEPKSISDARQTTLKELFSKVS